ncbi:protein of unknown function (DUF2808) [Rubidibacter lacunae KORDI 51-2]|uniref:DUF2808 domain-containing protein n=1 Tax=Rubidibacter lacunae KORDI 51-2 TaxID=582515 RepID=U5DQ45_9CHRO|nr:DUF2808 domain-containing protein [Rubidibacter lacunae]ERN41820.1 protein of unknown function (DUF2808) [Rubidibacter lacunae KORDI 51-2]
MRTTRSTARSLARSILLTLGLVGTLGVDSGALAVQLADGTVSFDAAPRLTNATATLDGVWQRGSKYFFTLELPADAGEPLQSIAIEQRTRVDDINYRLDRTEAFTGTHRDPGVSVPLASVRLDEETQTIAIDFAEPVPPGTTLTVRLRPVRNPRVAGNYVFAVMAFPRGEKPRGLHLGVRQLQFFDNGTFIN